MSTRQKIVVLARLGVGFSLGVMLAIVARPVLGLPIPEWLPLALLAVPVALLPVLQHLSRREREDAARRAARDLVDRIERERRGGRS